MFTRIKKSPPYQYLQIVENRWRNGKTRQRVIGTIGRMDRLKEKGDVDNLLRSLTKYSERALLLIAGKSDPHARTIKIGPALIIERLWRQLGIGKLIKGLLSDKRYRFDVERAIFLTVLHRLFSSGSDRHAEKWRKGYKINDVERIQLHHLYRAMAWLGSPLPDDEQEGRTPFAPRCVKDKIEEELFKARRDLFSEIDLVFFDTTSVYFEGRGGETIGAYGHSKDKRPDLRQMVIGAVLDGKGNPICCEMWPGNTADVKTLLPIINRLRARFNINRVCVVADRGMIAKDTIEELERLSINYILGARMRKDKDIRKHLISKEGYKEVYGARVTAKDPFPLKVKEAWIDKRRYIICHNPEQANADAQTRRIIIESLKEKLIKGGDKSLIGNKGYRRYLGIKGKTHFFIDEEKIKESAVYDGKWVLSTNAELPAPEIALKYKELWMVERIFRDTKTLLETRPIFHKCDETIRGHVFSSFLALLLRKELETILGRCGHRFEWEDMKNDLKALEETQIDDNGKALYVRSGTQGSCGKVFQAVGVALPPTLRMAP
ncbi:MAG: IS1634 family transposase [Candidatus Omnitrophica bacterium]|nr:IS1634 family transposase [Candidatus Omnitrophota bacterium]